jgi:hypothetical protein
VGSKNMEAKIVSSANGILIIFALNLVSSGFFLSAGYIFRSLELQALYIRQNTQEIQDTEAVVTKLDSGFFANGYNLSVKSSKKIFLGEKTFQVKASDYVRLKAGDKVCVNFEQLGTDANGFYLCNPFVD